MGKLRFIVDREMGRGESPLMPGRKLATVIWDPETKTPSVEFKKGIFETDDPAKIKLLQKLGYPCIQAEIEPDGESESGDPENQNEVKKRTTRKTAEQ